MTKSNSDLWCAIAGSIILVFSMCWIIYDDMAISNLRIVIPIVCFAAGYILHQNLEELGKRK